MSGELQIFFLFLVQATLRQQVGKACNGVERCSHFVRGDGDKFGFLAIFSFEGFLFHYESVDESAGFDGIHKIISLLRNVLRSKGKRSETTDTDYDDDGEGNFRM